MKILHVLLTTMPIPPNDYGGTERVLWALYQGQIALGHEVRFLTKSNPNNVPYIQIFDENKSMDEQTSGWADIVHFHWSYTDEISTPFVCTEHSNNTATHEFHHNTIYLSSKHANNHNAVCYVHNGLYWRDYGEPNLNTPRDYVHFLAKAAWRIKNLQGTVKIAKKANKKLEVLGGNRINIRRNPYIYLSSKIQFHGMVGGEIKNNLIKNSQGLLFPVLWHEPFGLAIIESLYLGCPVIATPFGSLPDIINDDVGIISDSYQILIEGVKNIGKFNRRDCHEYAKSRFNHLVMSQSYIECYEKVLSGELLNPAPPKSKQGIKDMLTMKD